MLYLGKKNVYWLTNKKGKQAENAILVPSQQHLRPD